MNTNKANIKGTLGRRFRSTYERDQIFLADNARKETDQRMLQSDDSLRSSIWIAQYPVIEGIDLSHFQRTNLNVTFP